MLLYGGGNGSRVVGLGIVSPVAEARSEVDLFIIRSYWDTAVLGGCYVPLDVHW